MKNILFISPTGTMDNGAEISIFNLMKYLIKLGYNVYTVAPQHNHPLQTDYYNRCQAEGIYAHFIPSIKWWWEDAPGGLAGTEEERVSCYRDNIYRINEFIDEKKIDLVISNTVNVFQGAVAAACKKVPHYWLIHEFPKNEFSYYLSKLKFIDNNSDNIYGVSGELHKELKKIFFNREIKSFIPYTNLDLEPLKKGNKHRIVSIGRITRGKNQLELIQAYSHSKLQDKELVFIGGWDEQYKNECEEWIQAHQLKNVQFLGNSDNPWKLVTDMDICVLTSSMETFGLVYVEALIHGVPVITSNNLGFKSVNDIFNFGTMYTLGDSDKLTSEIIYHLENFNEIKLAYKKFIPEALDIYNIETAYVEIVHDIEKFNQPKEKGITALVNLLTLNEELTKVEKIQKKLIKLKDSFFPKK